MDLYDSSDNPAPPGARVEFILAADGLQLRTARWQSEGVRRGTIVLSTGRGEFIEKHFEVIGELLARRFDVVIFDWRGQGLSARELPNRRKGHIDDFSLYGRDMEALEAHVLTGHCPKPWFGLGHSMGGAIYLMLAQEARLPFQRMVVTAPMLGIARLKYPQLVQWLMAGLDMAGFGGAFIPGGSATPYLARPFADNALTSDPVRFARFGQLVARAPDLTIGSPTIGWLNAAFQLMRQFDDEFARDIAVPCLIVAAGRDRVVDTAKAERFGLALKAGRTLTLAPAKHEILIECDALREQFWAAFDAFIPGTGE